ncbi:MAG TPA: N-acetyl-gamma-glutamyl-phosphate reductase [Thermoanaerobaculia bacterium]|nr:N-acetyl-gamma-glutamyl-phosphate reductase [Thermoanaerobaculia bacterium]
MRKRIAIVGASGYAGAELTARLAHHSGAEIVGVYSSSEPGSARFETIHPSLRGSNGPAIEKFSKDALKAGDPDFVFLATPNEVSAEIAGDALELGATVIDLSGAFRLKEKADYPIWYGFEHPAPHLLKDAVYGLTEWCNGELRTASLIANPGCYPTSVLLALKPLIPFLDREQPIICNSLSGVSGAGKKSDLAYSFSELSGNCKAYSVGTHRHIPEMKQNLELATYTPFVFTPHLLPTVRGILSTLNVAFLTPRTGSELIESFNKAYSSSPFVHVKPLGELPQLSDVVGTPFAEIGLVLLNGGKRAVIVSAIDNLLKGAATQAIQNFNRACSFHEAEGLR